MVCPGLEELYIKSMIEMVAARASRGSRLRTVRITEGQGGLGPGDLLELRKHVVHVEYTPGAHQVDYGSRDGDEEG